jgi:hypothetical protein
MKKVIFSLVVATAILSSCKKEEPLCNCGEIMSDNVTDYSVDIQNSCSGNVKKFYLYESDWMNAHVGSNYCIENTTSW